MLKRDHVNNLIRRHAALVGIAKLFAVSALMIGALAGCGGTSAAVTQNEGQSTTPPTTTSTTPPPTTPPPTTPPPTTPPPTTPPPTTPPTPPTISGTPATSVVVGSVYSFTPTVANPSGGALTFSIQGTPHWATFNTKSGQLNGAPSSADVGTASNIVISVTNGTTPAALPAFGVVVMSATTDPTTGLLPSYDDAYANWKNAGLQSVGGIPTRNTQCGPALNPIGGVPNGTSDDYTQITAAIASCAAGDFLLLNPGASTAVNISISGNTLTLHSGTLAIGEVIAGANIQTGTTVTAGSGTSWTVSFGPYPGSTVSNEAATAIVSYNVLTSEVPILLNKGISIRGGGSCTGNMAAPPVCPTVINVYNGAIPDWSISSTTAGANCGVASSASSECSTSAVLLVAPNGNYNFGWGGCTTGGSGTAPTSCGTFLAADVAQGATQIQVQSTKNFSVGQWVLIDELPALTATTNPAGKTPTTIQATSDFLNATASPATNRVANPDSAGGDVYAYSLFPNRVNAELHLVTAVGAGPCPGTSCTLTFDDPLSISFRQSGGHNSQVFWPTNCCSATYTPFLAQAGVENLSITRPGNTGVMFQFCTECWAKGIEVGDWINGAVSFRYSSRSQLTSSYLHHCADCENNGTEYPLSIDAAATEILVDNNIITLGGKGMVGRAAGAGVVIANNYFGPTFYMQASIGNFWNEMSINGSHYAGAHGFLFEGNLGSNCDNDDTHGNNGYDTFFRNHCAGIRDTFLDPSNVALTVNDSISSGFCGNASCGIGVPTNTGLQRAGGAMAYNYWHAFVGNVMGTSGVTTTGNGWVYAINSETGPGQVNKGIWALGWVGGGFTATDSHLNTSASPAYVFRNGNYDYVNAGIVDKAQGYSQSFPNSFYTASKPAYFSAGTCSYSWPWVTPTGSTPIQTDSCGGSGLPAKARYDAGTPFKQP